MTHNDTEKTGQEQMSTAQLQVLQDLLTGASVTAAAKSGQVSRETVHRWLREDFTFRAVYNKGRREILEEIQDTLLATARQAADTVAKAVADGDVKAALAVLKGVGGLPGKAPHIGPGDPARLEQEVGIAAKEEESMLALRSLTAKF